MKKITIYTDGACSGNPGPGGWGAILEYKGVRKEISGGEAETTNNRMENNSLVEATVPIPLKAQGGKIFELRVAVVNGALQDLKNVMKIINEDKDRWHFIEVMNCPGGCVNGGGQPLQGAGSSWLAPTTPLPVKL